MISSCALGSSNESIIAQGHADEKQHPAAHVSDFDGSCHLSVCASAPGGKMMHVVENIQNQTYPYVIRQLAHPV